jgi:hypothetical protein
MTSASTKTKGSSAALLWPSAPPTLYGVLRDALSGLKEGDLAQLRSLLEKLAGRMKVRDRGGKWIPLAEM